MLGFFEDVKIISSFHNKNKPYGKIQSRATHGFIFRIRGGIEYILNDRRFIVEEGSAVFLPKGSSYEYNALNDDVFYTSINFEANIENAEIKVYSIDSFHGVNFIFQNFSEAWKFGTASDKYKCLAIFYEFLSFISRVEHQAVSEERNYDLVKPAIEYIKKNIYNFNFKINKLHRLCGISDTYFRQIFSSIYSMSPKEYVLSERISHAKTIIENGEYDTIKEVAESVGYNDPLYFSKSFKKYYGYSPSSINK
ncbi:MAG: helix-turn-helix transcriptional regulator [Ruminococcaceae bacterium]|nr:helix-turn-helix transcriptional regulator [Oscillospiraceae bacterium]